MFNTWAGPLSPGSPGVVVPSRSLLLISSNSFNLLTKLATRWLAFCRSYEASCTSVFSWAISFWPNAYLSRISENWKKNLIFKRTSYYQVRYVHSFQSYYQFCHYFHKGPLASLFYRLMIRKFFLCNSTLFPSYLTIFEYFL